MMKSALGTNIVVVKLAIRGCGLGKKPESSSGSS